MCQERQSSSKPQIAPCVCLVRGKVNRHSKQSALLVSRPTNPSAANTGILRSNHRPRWVKKTLKKKKLSHAQLNSICHRICPALSSIPTPSLLYKSHYHLITMHYDESRPIVLHPLLYMWIKFKKHISKALSDRLVIQQYLSGKKLASRVTYQREQTFASHATNPNLQMLKEAKELVKMVSC